MDDSADIGEQEALTHWSFHIHSGKQARRRSDGERQIIRPFPTTCLSDTTRSKSFGQGNSDVWPKKPTNSVNSAGRTRPECSLHNAIRILGSRVFISWRVTSRFISKSRSTLKAYVSVTWKVSIFKGVILSYSKTSQEYLLEISSRSEQKSCRPQVT